MKIKKKHVYKGNGEAVLDKVDVESFIIDPSRHALGSLCSRGCDYHGTGKSARYIRGASLGNCVVCAIKFRRQSDAARKAKRAADKLAFEATIPVGSKHCYRCEESKSVVEFSRARTSKDGLYSWCKSCVKEHQAEFRNRTKGSEKSREARKRDWMGTILRGSRSSAKFRSLAHEITIGDLWDQWEKQGGRCHWLGIPMGDAPSLPNRHPSKPSIERLDQDIGYVKGNFVFATFFANMGRNNTSSDVFEDFLIELKASIMCGGNETRA